MRGDLQKENLGNKGLLSLNLISGWVSWLFSFVLTHLKGLGTPWCPRIHVCSLFSCVNFLLFLFQSSSPGRGSIFLCNNLRIQFLGASVLGCPFPEAFNVTPSLFNKDFKPYLSSAEGKNGLCIKLAHSSLKGWGALPFFQVDSAPK